MGIMISKVFQALFGSKEVRILILGLDNAGKTTILYRLQNEADDNIQTIPTIGFNVETLQYKNIKFQVGVGWGGRCTSACFLCTGVVSGDGGGARATAVDGPAIYRCFLRTYPAK